MQRKRVFQRREFFQRNCESSLFSRRLNHYPRGMTLWWMNNSPDKDRDNGTERGIAVKERQKTKKPAMYRVLLLNDDYTPMEFVVSILMGVFNKSPEDATRIMLNVHQTGIGTCGVYTFEVAETKVAQVMDAAKRNHHPLQCTLEKE